MRFALLCGILVVLVACGEKPRPDIPADAGPGTPSRDPDGGPGDPPDAGTDPEVTWYRDVLPIVQDNCQACHLSGGIAPFALTHYADAFAQHQTIANAVVTRRMPPWMADESCIASRNARLLSQDEIDLIAQWSAQGAPEGDPADAPPPPEGPPGLEWVDLTLDATADYTPRAEVTDDYRCFILPPAFTTQQDIIGFEVVPGTPTQVHHAIVFTVPAAEAQAKDDGEAGLGWTCYGSTGTNEANVRMVGGWVPGNGATPLPDTTGIRVAPDNVIVLQVHYNLANGAPLPDRTQVKLQLAKTPVEKPAIIFPIVHRTFAIPPNAVDYRATGSFVFNFGPFTPPTATLWGVTPHMHQLGRSVRVRNATTNQCLIHVPAWDFHWQQSYEYATPVTVARDDEIEIECAWDNPSPTRTVTWGEGTADEMCVAFLYATVP